MRDEPNVPTVEPTVDALLETQRERGRQIAADVFNPNETDLDYFRRRLVYHKAKKN